MAKLAKFEPNKEYHIIAPSSYISLKITALSILFFVMMVCAAGAFSFEYYFDVMDKSIPIDKYKVFITLSLIFSILFGVTSYLCLTCKKIYAFDPENKKNLKGFRIFSKIYGEWEDFDLNAIPNFSYIAFQQYEQSQTFSFMGVTKNEVFENMYELRMICGKEFITLVSTSEFDQLPAVVRLARSMAKTYNVKYYDYVKDAYRKERIIRM